MRRRKRPGSGKDVSAGVPRLHGLSENRMSAQQPTPLTDEQVRRFLADGFVVLDSDLPADFHAAVADELRYCMKHESPWPGDNVLPRVPQLGQLLESPVLRGALSSLLGPAFAWTPHRTPHNSEPLPEAPDKFDPFENNPRMGKGSVSGSGWHQDGHSRAGRARWHRPRAINVFYFAHDVPLAMGPTRLLAGSHLYANLHGVEAGQVFMREMPAGTIVIAHFDLAHAGAPNRTDRSRYMLKFVALRQRNPHGVVQAAQDAGWHTPAGLLNPHTVPQAWEHSWRWLHGLPAAQPKANATPAQVADALAALRTAHQGRRLAALYDLANMGEAAVPSLVDALLATAGKSRHISPPANDMRFYGASSDPLARWFSHRQCVPEDYAVALGLIGAPAFAPLLGLLSHEDAWIRLNAAYALGELGDSVSANDADRLGELLDDPSDAVVRTTLDALCCLGDFGLPSVQRIRRLLVENTPGWQAPAIGKHWSIQDQVRYAACWALTANASQDEPAPELESALVAALADRTGYVPAVACEGIERLGTPSALTAAVRHLRTRAWDTVHHRFSRAAGTAADKANRAKAA